MNAAMTDRSKEMGNGYEEDQTEISNYMSQQIGISSSLLLMIYIYMYKIYVCRNKDGRDRCTLDCCSSVMETHGWAPVHST